MVGKLRYLLAGAFVALFAWIATIEPDHDYLAFLETRSWLTGDESPLAELIPEGSAMPRLTIDGVPQGRRADYERIGREWARAKGRPPGEGAPLHLAVRVGDSGFRSTLFREGVEVSRVELTRQGGDRYYPDRWSLAPAFLAIILAIVTAKVIPSLLAGCLAGAWIYIGDPIGAGAHFAADTLWSQTLRDDFRGSIMLFVVFLFMSVGVMARSGGIQGMVEWIRRFARGPISSQLCSYLIGILIFFDDYTNCIITGSTMRPLCDRNSVSREKLAYIVDSTAAPVAGISIVSTWVAYEISMFSGQLPEVTRPDGALYQASEAFSVFVQTLPYRFYCIFTLMMVGLTILMRREFGAMLRAERRAIHQGKPIADGAQPMVSSGLADLKAPDNTKIRGRNAFVPVCLLVSLAIGLIWWFGYSNPNRGPLDGSLGEQLREILNNTASERALMWASLATLVVAIAMAVGQRTLGLIDALRSALRSLSSLIFALVILILAWCIGHICADLGTAQFLTTAFHGSFAPWLLPVVMFLVSSLVAFSTGTSYGTMAILLPNVVVLAHTMGQQDPTLTGPGLMILTIGAVLEGSIFGDHCSPISDTTVLSSVATASDHLHHVQTQAPYAVFTMLLAMGCGYIPMALWSRDAWPLSWLAAAIVIVIWLRVVGRSPDQAPTRAA